MLINIAIENFLSFKNKQTLSLLADSLKEHKDYLHIPFQFDATLPLLKSAVIYGHNSSGKSNFIRAFRFIQTLIFESFSYASTNRKIQLECFKLSSNCINTKSFFEITFISNSIKYRYGFEILKSEVLSEWLFYAEPKIRENYLFIRSGQDFKINKSWNKEILNKAEQGVIFTKPNVLFLSVLLQQDLINHIDNVGNWLRKNRILFDFNDKDLFEEAAIIISNPEYRKIVNFFISEAHLGFTTIEEKINSHTQNKLKIDTDLLRLAYHREIENFEIYTKHEVFDKNYKLIGYEFFNMLKNESSGTQKFFILASLLSVAIKNGGIVWIDELDARFHSLLLELTIKLFSNNILNVSGAQMIFTSHNTSMMNKKLRRDQINFAEKNEFGESSLRRMHTSQTPVRIDTLVEKEYLAGNLGGVPKFKKKNESQSEINFNTEE